MIMDYVHTIYPQNTQIHFTEDEAVALVDIFLRITRRARREVTHLKNQLGHCQGNKELINQLQFSINQEIQKWSDKIARLGAHPVALWKVKMLSDQAQYFTWEYPQSDILIVTLTGPAHP